VITSCARGHENHAAAKYCDICGLSMVQNSVLASPAQRSELEVVPGGVLRIGERTFELGDYAVVGRAPERADDVVRGVARPIMLDPMGVSSVHAAIRRVGWHNELCDLGSTNGTHVWDAKRDAWHRVEGPVLISDGAVVCFGSTEARFHEVARPVI